MWRGGLAEARARIGRGLPRPGGGEAARLQESEQDLCSEVKDLRAEVESLRERVEEVEGRVSRGPDDGDGGVVVDDVDAGQVVERHRPVVQVLRRIFPELITEQSEPGEERVYGAAAEDAIEWREAWAECRSARYALDWLRAERKRLDLEIRLIGVFGLTPPPADVPWHERRRDNEVDWRRRALWRLRWQIPPTWCLHWLLRVFTLGLWGRAKGT